MSYELRTSVTTLRELGNGKLLEDTEVWGSRIFQVIVDSTHRHYLMTDIKVYYITTQKPRLLLVFGMAGKPSIPRLVHRNPHALVSTRSSPWEGVCCGPRDDWRTLQEALFPQRFNFERLGQRCGGGQVSKDLSKQKQLSLVTAETTVGGSGQGIKPPRKDLALALPRGRTHR